MSESTSPKKTQSSTRKHSTRTGSSRTGKKIFLVIIFLAAQLMFFYSDFFKLKEIKVVGNHRVSAEEIIKTANIPVDRNIVTLPLDESKKKLDVIHWLKDVNIRWYVPGQVAIYVEEREPVILVRNINQPSVWYTADDLGMILDKAKLSEKNRYPRMTVEDDLEIGKQIEADKVKSIKELEPLISEKLRKNLLYYFIDERLEVVMFFMEKGKVYKIKFGKVRNSNQKLKTLNALLDLVKDKGVKVEYIDVRFREPILKPVESQKNKDKTN